MMIRAKYTKKGDLVYLSHLDLVRLFERAFRRAGVPLAFTQGFNPHPMISFAAPLSVGVSSEGEYVDVVLAEPMAVEIFISSLNSTLPKDIQILQAVQMDEKTAKVLMQEAALMVYTIQFSLKSPFEQEKLTEAVESFINEDEIIIQKKGKAGSVKSNKGFRKRKKVKEVDILPYIHTFRIESQERENSGILLKIRVFDQASIKPLLIFNKWVELNEIPIVPDSLHIERKEIYKQDKDGHYLSILE